MVKMLITGRCQRGMKQPLHLIKKELIQKIKPDLFILFFFCEIQNTIKKDNK